jgi:hypothetical protein
MRHTKTSIVFLLPILLGACTSIGEAPANAPRTELEVTITIAPQFLSALRTPDADLTQAIENEIIGQADVGLRFYPVRSTAYAEGQKRPIYHLNVQVQGLDLVVHATDSTGANRLERVAATLDLALNKRRDAAPALLVAQSTQRAERSPESGSDAKAMEATYTAAGDAAAGAQVSRTAILAAVRSATRAAFADMLRAIDREFR